LGLDLIITDHHLLEAGDAVPHALAILNPNQPNCTYPEKFLCGAAIALKLAQAILERRDLASTREKTLPSFLKMAAIATIADAVPLKGENRVIAALGLRELRRPAGVGLRALFAAAALDPAAKALTGYDVAFAWLRASTPPDAWMWPPISSSSSPRATRSAPPSWPPSWNGSTASAAKLRSPL